jgi:hypothetical protein
MFEELQQWYRDLGQAIAKDMFCKVIPEFDSFFSETPWELEIESFKAKIDVVDDETPGIAINFNYRHREKQLLLIVNIYMQEEYYSSQSPTMFTEFQKPGGSRGRHKMFRSLQEFFIAWPDYSQEALDSTYLIHVNEPNYCSWNETGLGNEYYSIEIYREADPPDILVRGARSQYRKPTRKNIERTLDFWVKKVRSGGIKAVDDYFDGNYNA